jgi:hypothetical protein
LVKNSTRALKNPRLAVIGRTYGIGRAIAVQAAAAAGAKVTIGSCSRQDVDSTVALLGRQSRGDVIDLDDRASMTPSRRITGVLNNRRLLNFASFAACAALMAYALYAQYGVGLDPCPLCIFQRVGVIALGVLIQFTPWLELIRKVLIGGGECQEGNWKFLGLAMPAWVLICRAGPRRVWRAREHPPQSARDLDSRAPIGVDGELCLPSLAGSRSPGTAEVATTWNN